MAGGVWTYVGGRAGNKPPPAEKAAITAACEKLIAEVLQPRFLPEVRPSAWPAPIGWSGRIFSGAWPRVAGPRPLNLGGAAASAAPA